MATQRQHDRALAAVREICMGFPEVTERLSHGAPTWFVRRKKSLCMFLDDHHGDGRLAIWCPAFPGVQQELIDEEPERFFRPPYVGPSGWVGVRLERVVDRVELTNLLADSYRKVAPAKSLVSQLDAMLRPG
jgi:hypothetical protein